MPVIISSRSWAKGIWKLSTTLTAFLQVSNYFKMKVFIEDASMGEGEVYIIFLCSTQTNASVKHDCPLFTLIKYSECVCLPRWQMWPQISVLWLLSSHLKGPDGSRNDHFSVWWAWGKITGGGGGFGGWFSFYSNVPSIGETPGFSRPQIPLPQRRQSDISDRLT